MRREVVARGRPLVGRDREIAALREGLADARVGRARLRLVTGELGIGRTRLCEEFAAIAREDGFEVLVGHCRDDGRSALPYLPWRQLLRFQGSPDPVGMTDRLAGPASRVTRLLPARMSSAPPDEGEVALYEAMAQLWTAAARDLPLLLILDDLHVADPPSVRLLQYLARALSGAAVMIVGTYCSIDLHRQPEMAKLLEQVAREAEILPLGCLTEADVQQLLDAIGGPMSAPVLARLLQRHTGGNPLYLDGLLHAVLAEGASIPEGSDRASRVVPEQVRVAVRRRIDLLDTACVEALTVAAVIGTEFDLPTVRRICADATPGGPALLEKPVADGLIRVVPDTPGRYGFAQPIVQDVLYEEMPSARRTALHASVAAALEQAHGSADPAADGSSRAGERALDLGAYPEAVTFFAQALQALETSSPDSLREGQILLRLGEAQWKAGDPAHAAATLLRASEILRRLGAAERSVPSTGRSPFDSGSRRRARKGAAASPEPQPATGCSLVRHGSFWTVEYRAARSVLKDCKGLQYLVVLLGQPGRNLHALTILTSGSARGAALEDPSAAVGRRVKEQPRVRADSAASRARVSVTRAIHRALSQIAAVLPDLGRHLEASIRTGMYCAYRPDPRMPIDWRVNAS